MITSEPFRDEGAFALFCPRCACARAGSRGATTGWRWRLCGRVTGVRTRVESRVTCSGCGERFVSDLDLEALEALARAAVDDLRPDSATESPS